MKWFLRIVLSLAALALVGILSLAVINKYVQAETAGLVQKSMTEIPAPGAEKPVAIVFGARVWPNGEPSNSLYDRVLTAVELYRAGRVGVLLMSGDRQNDDYDEPAAMKKQALALGVPERDIVVDDDGKRTYDTCARAREIFDVRRAVLVTQDYHQPRALYLCRGLGVESVGLTANRRTYDGERYYHFREFFSVASAWFELNFRAPSYARGPRRPIGR